MPHDVTNIDEELIEIRGISVSNDMCYSIDQRRTIVIKAGVQYAYGTNSNRHRMGSLIMRRDGCNLSVRWSPGGPQLIRTYLDTNFGWIGRGGQQYRFPHVSGDETKNCVDQRG